MLNLIGRITVRSPTTVIERRPKSLDVRTNTREYPRARLGGPVCRILVVKFFKKILNTTPSIPILCFFYNFAHELKDNKN
jgi:hypothetical protein